MRPMFSFDAIRDMRNFGSNFALKEERRIVFNEPLIVKPILTYCSNKKDHIDHLCYM